MKRNKNRCTFTKDELLLCIKKHKDYPVFYATGYDNMIQFINNKNTRKPGNIENIQKFINDNRVSTNVIYVIFNPKMKRYYIEKMSMKDFNAESVYMNNKKEHLLDVVRFLNKTTKIDDVKDCQICFDKLPHKYSESIFNLLTYTCERCFNTTCVSCYIKLQSEKKVGGQSVYEHICPFCKMNKRVNKKECIYVLNKKDCVIERDVYNTKVLEMDAISKETEDESVVKEILYNWFMSL